MPEDHVEHVVEIMGHTACQPPDGFHFLGLYQLHFKMVLFRDVQQESPDMVQTAGFIKHGCGVFNEVNPCPVGFPENGFVRRHFFVFNQGIEKLPALLPAVVNILDRGSQCLGLVLKPENIQILLITVNQISGRR